MKSGKQNLIAGLMSVTAHCYANDFELWIGACGVLAYRRRV